MIEINDIDGTDADLESFGFAGFPLCFGEGAHLIERGSVMLVAAGCAIKRAFTSMEASTGDAIERLASRVRGQ